MPDMDLAALEAALADLRRKLAKRTDAPGYAANVIAVRARIAQLETERAALLGQA